MQMDTRPHNMTYPGLYHHQFQSPLYGTSDDPLLARAEAAAMSEKTAGYHHLGFLKHDPLYGSGELSMHQNNNRHHQLPIHGFCAPGESMLDQLTAVSMPLSGYTPDHSAMNMSLSQGHSAHMYNTSLPYSNQSHAAMSMAPQMCMTSQMCSPHSASAGGGSMMGPMSPHGMPHHSHHDLECDPRELEAFAEHFKQRRIKLGVTQADVGSALGKLKIPGVGSLSQSTICRFESLTLSHNNMIALKPVLQTWLEEAEAAAREALAQEESMANDKKKKRTSITAAEKRSLEAYFAVQPRPSGEKITQIADKLGLKKSVVRVWFCNQRQKQKRMKFSSVTMQGPQVASLGR